MASLTNAMNDPDHAQLGVANCGRAPETSQLPSVLREALATSTVRDRAGNSIPLSSNISLAEAVTLYQAVMAVHPRTTVETGFAHGISTLAILQAHRDTGAGIHHVIDPFQANYGDAGLAMVEHAGLAPWLQFHRKFPEEVIPDLPTLQFAFIDSSHLFDNTIAELYLIDRKLEVGGLIALHDTWMSSIQKALRFILANRRYEIARQFEQVNGPPRHPSWRQRLKRLVATVCRSMPALDRLFREEVLRPWEMFGVQNLVVLRKIGDDDRPWTFHAPF